MNQTTNKLIFMSAEHVAVMNGLLAKDACSASQRACAALERTYWMVYELDHAGRTVWWSMEFNPTAGTRFHLAPPPQQADVLFRGDYAVILDGMRLAKAGQSSKEKVMELVTTHGDPGALAKIGPAFAAAQACATVDAEIPVVATS
jgi:hypothetical protein